MGSHKGPYWVLFYFFIYKNDLYRNLIDAKSHFNTYNNGFLYQKMGFVFWPGGKKNIHAMFLAILYTHAFPLR